MSVLRRWWAIASLIFCDGRTMAQTRTHWAIPEQLRRTTAFVKWGTIACIVIVALWQSSLLKRAEKHAGDDKSADDGCRPV